MQVHECGQAGRSGVVWCSACPCVGHIREQITKRIFATRELLQGVEFNCWWQGKVVCGESG